jgi:hypothetical protein
MKSLFGLGFSLLWRGLGVEFRHFSLKSFKIIHERKVDRIKAIQLFFPNLLQVKDPCVTIAGVSDGVGHLLDAGREAIQFFQKIVSALLA